MSDGASQDRQAAIAAVGSALAANGALLHEATATIRSAVDAYEALPVPARAEVDAIVARARQAIETEQHRKATLGSRKLSRRQKKARR